MRAQIRLSVAVFLLAVFFVGRSTATSLQKIVIDTDAGADDAIAILLTLQAESVFKYKVLALTCSYGNTEEHNVEANVLKTLTIAERGDVKVYAGATKPFINKQAHDHFFGTDGFGDFEFDREITGKIDRSKHAAVALVELAKKYPKEITLLALGPLTNIATAIALDPDFLSRLQRLVILGSSVSGVGAISPGAEFNFFQDPESNFKVLNSTQSLITIVPWETITGMKISKDWRVNVLGKVNSTIVDFLNKAERVSLIEAKQWNSGDTLAAATMIWPEIAYETVITNVYPVTDGAAKGTVLVDYERVSKRPDNAVIVKSIHTNRFKELLLEYLA